MDHREILQRSLDYIEDNLKTEITAAELADMAGFSLYHYYRLFQSATGIPVMQYLLRRRLLHGIYAVREGSSGIEAALTYGFDTYAGFYRAFLREFGCTPSEFLRSSRAKKPYRLNLYKEEHMTVTHKKVKEILKHWDLENETVSDIYYDGTGNKNENACYVGDRFVLKYTANPGRLKTHIALSKAMDSIGLCAAVPAAAADGREFIQEGELYFCLTRRLPGTPVGVGDLYTGDSAGKARFVGEIIGQLHRALEQVELCAKEADLLETVRSWALPKAGELLDWDRDSHRAWLDAFASLYPRLPRQIIHRDPNPGNIIRAGDKWGFLDFELSERNARLFDPCYAATAVLSESGADAARWERWPELYRNILLGYDSVVKLTEAEWKAAPYIVLANQLICVAWFAEQEKYAELLETNRRMTQWLLEHFDALLLNG